MVTRIRDGQTIIISDSMLRQANFRGFALLRAFRGATIETLIQATTRGNITRDWSKVGLVVIACGTNDIANGAHASIRQQMEQLINTILAENPSIGIIISGILPRPVDFDTTNSTVKRVNEVLRIWARSQVNVHFYPAYRSFLHAGRIRTDQQLYAPNDPYRIHLSEQGKARMVRLLKAQINLFRRGSIL